MAGPDRAGRRREERTLLAATLTNGPNELIDFILPLWAGAQLGLSGTAVGILLAVEMALSIVVRPLAGVLADHRERRHIAAAGALLYAVSCLGYAVASDPLIAYAAAAVGGAGGALFWVCVRAIVSERLSEDSAVFPRLLSAQETGTWVAFIGGMWLIGMIDFVGLFLACAAACTLAAILLLTSPGRQHSVVDTAGRAAAGLWAVGHRLRPILFAVVMTMMAEAAIALLLLLHLQREAGLDVMQIALVFLPGAIAMSVGAEYLHRFVVRYGRTRILAVASLFSSAFAVGLAWAPNAYVIAALWILTGLSWAAVMPIQQAVIAEASQANVGRGMGVYESASLVGALLGTVLAGAGYDWANWVVACLVAAAMLAAGAVVVPWAVRQLGVIEFPPAPPSPPLRPARPARPTPARDAGGPAPARTQTVPVVRPRRLLANLAGHIGLYAAVQAVLVLADLSWLRHLVTDDPLQVLNGTNRDFGGVAGSIYVATKVWAGVLAIDLLRTFTKVSRVRRQRGGPPAGTTAGG